MYKFVLPAINLSRAAVSVNTTSDSQGKKTKLKNEYKTYYITICVICDCKLLLDCE